MKMLKLSDIFESNNDLFKRIVQYLKGMEERIMAATQADVQAAIQPLADLITKLDTDLQAAIADLEGKVAPDLQPQVDALKALLPTVQAMDDAAQAIINPPPAGAAPAAAK